MKSREPTYSQALVQNKIDRQRVRSRESGRQGRQSDGYGGWCLELRRGREQRRRGQVRIGFVAEQCFKFGVKELWRDRGEVLMSSYYYNRMNQIVVAVLAGVYSERAGQLWL